MVCQGECFTKELEKDRLDNQNQWETMSMQIEFACYSGKVGWRIKTKPQKILNLNVKIDDTSEKIGKKEVTEADLEARTSILK